MLPPLRDRKDDIPLLVQHFIEKYGEENRKPDLELVPDALDILMSYDWPGNVRELENVIERAVVLSTGRRIGPDLLPDHIGRPTIFQMPRFVVPPEGISFKDVITDFEKRLIESTLEAAGGVQKRAAELLRIKPTTLNEMIKRYDIRPRRKRSESSRADVPDAVDRVGEPARWSRDSEKRIRNNEGNRDGVTRNHLYSFFLSSFFATPFLTLRAQSFCRACPARHPSDNFFARTLVLTAPWRP